MLFLFLSLALNAATLEKMDFAETLSVEGTALTLNGVGLRSKRVLGIRFKGYVAGLYVRAKVSKTADVLSQKGPKVVELAFLRSLGKSTLTEAWSEGLEKNCGAPCAGEKTKALNALMRDVREGRRLRIVFLEDQVQVEMHGREEAKGSVPGAEFATGLLKVFIGDAPPTEELKKGLLGG